MRVRIRVRAAEQRLIATGSQVNVAEQRLKDTQSQGDDSPATPLRLTSSSAAINRSEAAHPLIRSSAHPFRLFFELGVVLDEPFGYLYGIEGSALLDLVAYEPEGKAVGVGDVLADTAHIDIVAAFQE